MARESSSRNDQLDAPLIAPASCQGRLQSPQDRLGAPAEHWLTLPREVIAEEANRLYTGLTRQVAESAQAAQRAGTEQVALVMRQPPRGEHPAPDRSSRESPREEQRPRPHQGTSCRATSACASVTPSTYSRSPPMRRPRASRVTRTPWPARSCWMWVAVTSPSIDGLVARMTSRTAPSRARATRWSSRSDSGPIPSSGESRPPST